MAPHTEPARYRPFHHLATITLLLLAASACAAAAAPCSDAQGCQSAGLEEAGSRGPVGSVRQQQYTVSGTLLIDNSSVNWWGVGSGPVSDDGILGAVAGVYENFSGADNVPIYDVSTPSGGTEFGVVVSDTRAGFSTGVLTVDMNSGGSITVRRNSATGAFARSATITLTSSLFGQYTDISGPTGESRVATRSAIEELKAQLVKQDDSMATKLVPEPEAADSQATIPPTPVHTQATVQQNPTWISASLSANTITMLLTGAWPNAGQTAEFQLFTPPCPDGSACCDSEGGFLTGSTVCRHALGCQLESRCDGVSPDCPPSKNKDNGDHCPWYPPTKLPKRGYHPYSSAAPMAAKTTYEHEWHECDGVCDDGVCALEWEGPECCHIAGRHGYYRREEEHYGPRYDAADAQAVAGTTSSEHWEAGDLYCRG